MIITKYRIVDHGIEHAQYFRGHSTFFSSYDHTVLGCGDNFAEALEDALDSMAQMDETEGVDFAAFEEEMLADEGLEAWPTSPSVSEEMEAEEDAEDGAPYSDGNEWYYYVSIDYSTEPEPGVEVPDKRTEGKL